MNAYFSKFVTCTLLATLAGCSGSARVVSELTTADASGVLDSPFSGSEQVTTTRIEDGSGYSIQIFLSESDLTAGVFVGRVETSTTGTTVRNGSATYTGNWDAVAVKDAFSPVKRQEFGDTGEITLTADFDNSSLTGESVGLVSGETLVINGRIGERSIDGTATYAGLDAEIDGRIGDQRTYGVFQGDDGKSFVGGGWLATPE